MSGLFAWQYLVSFLVLQSPRLGRASELVAVLLLLSCYHVAINPYSAKKNASEMSSAEIVCCK